MTFGIKDYALVGMALVISLLLWRVNYVSDELDTLQIAYGESQADKRNAEEVAGMCSRSVAGLQEAAKALSDENAKLVGEAKDREKQAGQQAQTILSTPMSVPNDACKSAENLAREWLQGRRK